MNKTTTHKPTRSSFSLLHQLCNLIPAHLVHEVVERGEDIMRRDAFGHLRLRQKRYTPGEVDRAWSPEIEADFQQWLAAGRPEE